MPAAATASALAEPVATDIEAAEEHGASSDEADAEFTGAGPTSIASPRIPITDAQEPPDASTLTLKQRSPAGAVTIAAAPVVDAEDPIVAAAREFAYESTFQHMRMRALERSGDTYNVPVNKCTQICALFLVLICASIGFSLHYHGSVSLVSYSENLIIWVITSAIVIFLVLPLQMPPAVKQSILVLVVLTSLLAAIDGEPWPVPLVASPPEAEVVNSTDPRQDGSYYPITDTLSLRVYQEWGLRSTAGLIILGFCLFLELSVMGWCLFSCVRKRRLRREQSGKFSSFSRDWRVRPLEEPGQYEYWAAVAIWRKWVREHGLKLLSKPPEQYFGYVGEVDEEGRPHGIGRWNDTARIGECLEGRWVAGVPAGPFTAHESGSGYSFSCVLVGVCLHRRDGWKGIDPKAQRADDGARWAVVGVECSISGQFFTSLPKMRIVAGPTGCAGLEINPDADADADADADVDPDEMYSVGAKTGVAEAMTANAEWCLRRLHHMDDNRLTAEAITIAVAEDRLLVSGYVPAGGPGADFTQARVRLISGERSSIRGSLGHLRRSSLLGLPKLRPVGEDADADASTCVRAAPTTVSTVDAATAVSTVDVVDAATAVVAVDAGVAAAGREHCGGCGGCGFEAAATLASPSEVLPEVTEDVHFGGFGRGLRVDGWQPARGAGSEAVVFVHGCNSSVNTACLVLGQLFSMGNFPAHVKPFVYGWPCGTIPKYYVAAQSAESATHHADFVAFLRGLIAAGVVAIHLIGHSMGGRFLCSAMHMAAPLFLPAKASRHRRRRSAPAEGARGERPVRLSSLIFLHPESDLDRFIAQDFKVIRRVCSNICLYTDRADAAVQSAELLLYRFGWILALTGGPRQCSTAFPGYRSLGLHPEAMLKPNGKPLDMDVVDVSWMDHNVSNRHNFFTKNHWMVSDVRDIIVDGLRASGRNHRLLLRTGNMYSFIAAPSHVH